jgi:hypothetical protein
MVIVARVFSGTDTGLSGTNVPFSKKAFMTNIPNPPYIK